MAIAGAVVVPVDRESLEVLKARFARMKTIEIQKIGPRGIAVVLEDTDTNELRKLSKTIEAWDEVVDFQLAYVNWEELADDT